MSTWMNVVSILNAMGTTLQELPFIKTSGKKKFV